MSKKTLIITILAIILLLCIGIYFLYSHRNVEKTILGDPGKAYEEYEPQVFSSDDSVKVTLYLPNDDLSGYEKKEVTYKGEGLSVQKQVINDLLFNYLKDKVQVPEGTAVLDLNIWDETLKVNFNKKVSDIKVNNPRAEKYVIGSIVNSLLTTSDKFTDVQFLVEGNRVDSLFGHINTRNPFMFVR